MSAAGVGTWDTLVTSESPERDGIERLKALMQPLMVVEVEITGQVLEGFFGCDVFAQVDPFILDGTPQSFREDVAQGASLAVHADVDACCQQALRALRAGEVV
jgi:hypothetical protein